MGTQTYHVHHSAPNGFARHNVVIAQQVVTITNGRETIPCTHVRETLRIEIRRILLHIMRDGNCGKSPHSDPPNEAGLGTDIVYGVDRVEVVGEEEVVDEEDEKVEEWKTLKRQ